MAKSSLSCCLLILLYAPLFGDVKSAYEPTATGAVTAQNQKHVTCVYTYGCVADEATCSEGCKRVYHGFNRGCTFTLPTCPCACFCMTHREKIEDCHYPPSSANPFIFDIHKLGLPQ